MSRGASGCPPSVTRSHIGPVERKDRSSAVTVLTSPCFLILLIQLHRGAVLRT